MDILPVNISMFYIRNMLDVYDEITKINKFFRKYLLTLQNCIICDKACGRRYEFGEMNSLPENFL